MLARPAAALTLLLVASACTGRSVDSEPKTADPATTVTPTTPTPAPPTPPSTTTGATATSTTLARSAGFAPVIEPDPEFVLRYATPGPVDMRSNPFGPRDQGEFPEVFAAHMYRLLPPTFTLIPELAADDEPPAVEFDGTGWVAEVELNVGLTWSDGNPIDAFDVQFTFEDLVRFGDPDEHGWAIEDPRGTADLVSVTAVNDHIVRVRFSGRPTLDRWHYGVATASILPEHYWSFTFSTLAGGNERNPELGLDAPSAGGYQFNGEVDEGEWEWQAVNEWWNSGAKYTVYENGAVGYRNLRIGLDEVYAGNGSGEVRASWVDGPYANGVVWTSHANQQEAMFSVENSQQAGLVVGGVRTGLHVGLEPEHSRFIRSPEDQLAVLLLNPSHPALVDSATRAALSCFLFLEFLTENVLEGLALQTGWIPDDLARWSSPGFDGPCPVDKSMRVYEGVTRMEQAGWTWEASPVFEGGASIGPATGLARADIDNLDLVVLSPLGSADPLLAAAGFWVEGWFEAVGFGARVVHETDNPAIEWDAAIVAVPITVPPGLEVAGPAGIGSNHLAAPSIDIARVLWQRVRESAVAQALAVPLFTWFHTDFVRRDLSLPFAAVLGGFDPARIATSIEG